MLSPRRFILRESNSAFRFTGFQSQRPVGRRAGKNHANGPLAAILRQRLKKGIKRAGRCTGSARGRIFRTPLEKEAGVGRYHVNLIGLDAEIIGHLQ